MATIKKNASGTYTVTFTSDEQPMLRRCEAAFGESIISELVTNWLADHRKNFQQQDARDFVQNLDQATPESRVVAEAKFSEAMAAIVIPEPVAVEVEGEK